MAETRNAFTVDLEDWFHICAAGDTLASTNWDRLPSRVVLTPAFATYPSQVHLLSAMAERGTQVEPWRAPEGKIV